MCLSPTHSYSPSFMGPSHPTGTQGRVRRVASLGPTTSPASRSPSGFRQAAARISSRVSDSCSGHTAPHPPGAVLLGHTCMVTHAAFSPDGSSIITTSRSISRVTKRRGNRKRRVRRKANLWPSDVACLSDAQVFGAGKVQPKRSALIRIRSMNATAIHCAGVSKMPSSINPMKSQQPRKEQVA
jgi:hypothetical protein